MPDWQESFPSLHNALAGELRELPVHRIEAIVHETFGEDVSLADAEGFFDDIGRTLSRAGAAVAPVLGRALPGVASGAMTGAALGPFGALGGALIGGATSLLGGGGGGGGGRAPVPRAPAVGGPTASVAQLLGTLGSPTVHRALSAMMLGPAGARSVPTPGGGQLPVAAITNLLGMLAGRASAEWESVVPSTEIETNGEAVDLVSPESRAALVAEQLAPIEALDESLDEAFDESVDEAFDESLDEALADEAWVAEVFDEIDEAFDESDEAFDEASDEALDEAWSL